MSRQRWLRDPNRPRTPSKVDSRPMEASMLVSGQDTMAEMVRAHVSGMVRRAQHESEEEEDFLPDDEFEQELDLSEHQLADLAEQMEAAVPPPPSPKSDDQTPVEEVPAAAPTVQA